MKTERCGREVDMAYREQLFQHLPRLRETKCTYKTRQPGSRPTLELRTIQVKALSANLTTAGLITNVTEVVTIT
jgi:hypothetical protein